MGIAGSRVTCCSPTSCLFFQLFGFYRQEWSFYRQTLGFEPHTLVLGRNAIFVGQITFLASKSLNFCSFTWQLFIHCRMQSGQVLIWALVGTGVDMSAANFDTAIKETLEDVSEAMELGGLMGGTWLFLWMFGDDLRGKNDGR